MYLFSEPSWQPCVVVGNEKVLHRINSINFLGRLDNHINNNRVIIIWVTIGFGIGSLPCNITVIRFSTFFWPMKLFNVASQITRTWEFFFAALTPDGRHRLLLLLSPGSRPGFDCLGDEIHYTRNEGDERSCQPSYKNHQSSWKDGLRMRGDHIETGLRRVGILVGASGTAAAAAPTQQLWRHRARSNLLFFGCLIIHSSSCSGSNHGSSKITKTSLFVLYVCTYIAYIHTLFCVYYLCEQTNGEPSM